MPTSLSVLCLPMANPRPPKVWRVATNVPNGTSARMMVFASGNPPTQIVDEGAVSVSGGIFSLNTLEPASIGTLRFAVVHNWNGVTGTTSIRYGPCIANLAEQ